VRVARRRPCGSEPPGRATDVVASVAARGPEPPRPAVHQAGGRRVARGAHARHPVHDLSGCRPRDGAGQRRDAGARRPDRARRRSRAARDRIPRRSRPLLVPRRATPRAHPSTRRVPRPDASVRVVRGRPVHHRCARRLELWSAHALRGRQRFRVAARRGRDPRRCVTGAIVLAADYRGLGVVRSLGRRGVPVIVLTQPGERLAGLSRYARGVRRPKGDLVEHVLGLERYRGWALFPTTDEDAALLARSHEALSERFVVTTPPWDVLRWAYDKRLMHEVASELGIAAPWTAFGRPEAKAFPVVLKPAVKVSFNRLTAAKAWRVDTQAELERRFEEAAALVGSDVLMVQELIAGGGDAQLSYAALVADGVPVAALTARRARQYPADFGRASTYVETAHAPDIVEPSERFLRRIRFTGLVELEYKRDARDGVPKLLDVNPRVWGWHTLGAAAGVDFPWLLWLQLAGAPVPHVEARNGVRWLRLSTDL